MKVTLFSVLLLLSFQLAAQKEGTLTDNRDGQTYKTVTYQIKRKGNPKTTATWMAENLNFAIDDSYCRDDSVENCEKYGRLYTWPAAMKSCPKGWHLPTDEDWKALVDLFGGMNSAGTHLKSKSDLWLNNGQGTNKSGFNAMPFGTGISSTGYYQFGLNAIFWSASEVNETSAWDWILVGAWKKIMRSDGNKLTTGNAVRCVKN